MDRCLPFNDEAAHQPDTKYVLLLSKGNERFIIAYRREEIDAILAELGVMAADKQQENFSWLDAATLSQRIRYIKDGTLPLTPVPAVETRDRILQLLEVSGYFRSASECE